jgi:small subunit ribosomal protein S20
VAHSSSAKKRIKQNEVHRLRNRRRKDAVKDAVRVYEDALSAGAADKAAEALKGVYKNIDRTADQGTMHKKTAARRKSRLAKRLNKIAAVAK